MVRQTFSNKRCNTCGAELVCPECGVPSLSGTPFSNWIRAQPIQASCHDIDYVWHHYKEGWFITIEEKCHGAVPTRSQTDTQAVVFQLLRAASGRRCLTMRGWREIEYRGHFTIVFQNTTPDDGALTINNVPATRDDVIQLLENGKFKPTEGDIDDQETTEGPVRKDSFQEPP